MKLGLNFSDVNRLREGLANGESVPQIASACHCMPDVIEKYLKSMPQDEVQELLSRAPAQAGAVDIGKIREQLKAELLEELKPKRRGAKNPDDDGDDIFGETAA